MVSPYGKIKMDKMENLKIEDKEDLSVESRRKIRLMRNTKSKH